MLDCITTYVPFAFSRFVDCATTVVGCITTMAGCITAFAVNITTFAVSISVWVESNPIILHIGCAILHVGIIISLYNKMDLLLDRLDFWIEKSAHYVMHLGKTLISGRQNRSLPSISPINLVSMDIMFSVPTATLNDLSGICNPISALSTRIRSRMGTIWFDTHLDDVEWLLKEGHIFRLSTFKRYKKFLGLKCFGNLNITKDTLHLCNFHTGLKSLLDHEIISHIVQVRILTFNHFCGKYVWGMFYVLVTLGVGVVVWYKFSEGIDQPFLIPVEFLETPAYETFKNPYANVKGYDRLTYFIRNDKFLKLVQSAYYAEPPMDDLLPPIEDIMRNKHYLTPHYASISTAITIASFIAANMLIHGTRAMMQQ